jgi:hypothetical protein
MERGPEALRKYRFLNSFRPWWASQRWLPPDQRPVPLGTTALLLLGLAAGGAGLATAGLLRRRASPGPQAEGTALSSSAGESGAGPGATWQPVNVEGGA